MIWQSDAMAPVIDFGDEIRIMPTDGIPGDSLHMVLLDGRNVQPRRPGGCARRFTGLSGALPASLQTGSRCLSSILAIRGAE